MARRTQEPAARKDVVAGLVAALRDALEKPIQLSQEELAGKAYEKLGFDFPVVSSQELSALAVVYRDSLLNRKSSKHVATGQQGQYPLTPKFLENVLQGTSSATQDLTKSQAAAPPGSTGTQRQQGVPANATQGLQSNGTPPAAPGAHVSGSSPQTGLPGTSAAAAPTQGELLQPLAPSLAALHEAYIHLASATLVDLVNTLVSLPEHDAWPLVSALAAEQQQQQQQQVLQVRDPGHAQAPAGSQASSLDNSNTPVNSDCEALDQVLAGVSRPNGSSAHASQGDAHQVAAVQDLGIIDVEAAEEDGDDCVYEPLDCPPTSASHAPPFLPHLPAQPSRPGGGTGASHHLSNGSLQLGSELWPQLCQVIRTIADRDNLSVLATALAASSSPSSGAQPHNSSSTSGNTEPLQGSTTSGTSAGGAPDAANTYGALSKGSRSSAMVLGSKRSTTGGNASSGPHANCHGLPTGATGGNAGQPQQGSLPTQQQQHQQQGSMVQPSSQPTLLTTVESILSLLRTLGIHAHAADLAPLLASYTWLLAACLPLPQLPLVKTEEALAEVWQALGVTRWVSMPRGAALSRARGGNSSGTATGTPLLHPEAAAALSFVAHLSVMCQGTGSPTSSATGVRGALWRSLHAHMLPVLERCLSDLAAAAQQLQRQQGSGPGEDLKQELAESVSLVCTAILVYIESRPGGATPCKTLLLAGIVRGLSLLLAALPSLPFLATCEPLLGASWVLASGSAQVWEWMSAVPGVPAAVKWLSSTQASPAARVYGAAWQLLSDPPAKLRGGVAASGCAGAQQGRARAAGSITSGTPGAASSQLLQEALRFGDLEQVSGAERLLQVLVRGRRGADTSSPTWLTPLQPALQSAAGSLKQQLSSSSSGGGGGGSAGGGVEVQVPVSGSHLTSISSSKKTDAHQSRTRDQQPQQERVAGQHVNGSDSVSGSDHDHQGLGSPADDQQARSARQRATLLKSCQSLIKQLQTAGGKAD